MQRVLQRDVSNLMLTHNMDVNALDIDLYAINYCVRHNHFNQTITKMLGQNVMLSSSKTRKYPTTNFLKTRTLTISFHPSVIFIPHHGTPDVLKENICRHLRSSGQMVFASAPADNYLISGNEKGIPTLVLTHTLRACGVRYIRILHFGTKMPYNFIPIQESNIVSECDAVERGILPENEYHISVNMRSDHIFAAKVNQANLIGKQTIFPTFIPLDMRPSPQESMGGLSPSHFRTT